MARRSSEYSGGIDYALYTNIRAGRSKMVLIRVRTAETVRPINRNGSESNHTKGHATRTINASGQLSKNRMHQPISSSSAFMGSGLMCHNGTNLAECDFPVGLFF